MIYYATTKHANKLANTGRELLKPSLAHAPIDRKVRCLFATLGLALSAFATAAVASQVVEMEQIYVVAQRDTRAINVITAETIAAAQPGSTAFKLINNLPGVNFQAADAFGAYEWANEVSLRGFATGQIGYTLDGLPLGNANYSNNNGLAAHRAIDSENLELVSVAPGSGALDTASNSALGGAILLKSSDPEDQYGWRGTQMLGSHHAVRTHVRLDTGAMLSGTKAYFSVSSTTSDKWKGAGSPGQSPFGFMARDDGDSVTGGGAKWGNYHDQFNTKIVHVAGNNRVSFFYNYSDKRENDYADLTLPVYKQRGRYFDNYTDWQDARRDTREEAYYGSAVGYRNDHLASLAIDLRPSNATRLEITPYFHRNLGNGDWHVPYYTGDMMEELKFRRSTYEIHRSGVNSKLTLKTGNHELAAGLWLERNKYDNRRTLYNLYDWTISPTVNFDSARLLFNRHFDTDTAQYFVQDTLNLRGGALRLSAGAKGMRVRTDFNDRLGIFQNNSLVTEKTFLPQIGANYLLTGREELFLNYAENLAAKPITAFTTRVFDPDIKAEHSKTWEAGIRTLRENFEAALALYKVDYSDRQLLIANCALQGTCPTMLANVGKVTTQGIEASALWRPNIRISWYNALTFNDSRYASDYVSGGINVNATGKTVVNAPNWMFVTDIAYESGGFFAGLNGKYNGERYASYTNDLKVPAYTLWNLVLGYKQKRLGDIRDFKVQLNVDNLTDEDYLGSIGSSGIYTSDPTGASTYFQAGAPRGLYVSVQGRY